MVMDTRFFLLLIAKEQTKHKMLPTRSTNLESYICENCIWQKEKNFIPHTTY
jgi:hypothetical protein